MYFICSTYNTMCEANFEALTAVFVLQITVLSLIGLTSENGNL